MLHQHEGHAGVCRQMLEQLRERLQTTGRRTDTDYWGSPHWSCNPSARLTLRIIEIGYLIFLFLSVRF